MLTPRSHQGWIALVAAVLLASTIVTACLAAVVTSLLFPNGFLIDVPMSSPPAAVATTIPPALATTEPRQDPTTTGATPPDNDQPAASGTAFRWRASVSCSVSLDDIDEVEKPE